MARLLALLLLACDSRPLGGAFDAAPDVAGEAALPRCADLVRVCPGPAACWPGEVVDCTGMMECEGGCW